LYHVWLVDTGNVAVVVRVRNVPSLTMENLVKALKSAIVIVVLVRVRDQQKKTEVGHLVLVLPSTKKNGEAKMNNELYSV